MADLSPPGHSNPPAAGDGFSPEPPLRGRIDKKLQGLPHVEEVVETDEA